MCCSKNPVQPYFFHMWIIYLFMWHNWWQWPIDMPKAKLIRWTWRTSLFPNDYYQILVVKYTGQVFTGGCVQLYLALAHLGVINRFISFYRPFSPHIYRQSSVSFKQRCLDNSRGDEVGNLYSLHLTWQRYRATFKVLPWILYVSLPSEGLHFWSFIFILLWLGCCSIPTSGPAVTGGGCQR